MLQRNRLNLRRTNWTRRWVLAVTCARFSAQLSPWNNTLYIVSFVTLIMSRVMLARQTKSTTWCTGIESPIDVREKTWSCVKSVIYTCLKSISWDIQSSYAQINQIFTIWLKALKQMTNRLIKSMKNYRQIWIQLLNLSLRSVLTAHFSYLTKKEPSVKHATLCTVLAATCLN